MQALRSTRTTRTVLAAATSACLAAGAGPALAATPAEEDQAVTATTNRLVEQAKTKLRGFAGGLSLSPAEGTDVPVGTVLTARVRHVNQPGEQLTGKVFVDAAAAVGELPVTIPPVGFTPRDALTGAALPTSQAVLGSLTTTTTGGIRTLTDRKTVLLRPPFFQAGTPSPGALSRGIDARVPLRLDLPPLGQLAGSMSTQLGQAAPGSTQKLVAFVFDHLTPAGYSTADGLCRFLPSDHPRFCGSALPNLSDPDPTHAQLFGKLKAIDITPALTEVVHNLPTRLLDVLPHAIPSLSAWFRHKYYAPTDASASWCADGFALVVVAPNTPGAATVAELTNTLNGVRSDLGKLTALAGMAVPHTSLDTLLRRVRAVDGTAVKVWGQTAPNLDDEGKFTMVGGGNCTWYNDIEAEDEISSGLAFGLPGGKWKVFKDQSFGGSSLMVGPDASDWLWERGDLHTVTSNFGDTISSLRMEVTPSRL